ncbi:MAG TPA: tetratricopeptide repeat protein [Bacteroidales bacterium]|nr:tetratricopeptide repeat protein [Bacteroidales bacterium]HOR82016.1 tetratricopeptide repeat protein [Bacteroidales bacterium]HPJ91292.1 tetratricopeptide repeat protein [Bacteroidales bacterium]
MIFSRKKNITLFIFFFVAVVFFINCSTKKNAFINRAYHGITTRYNIYFNGNESYKEAKALLEKTTEDNYTNILPVYIYPDRKVALSFSPQWDRTIEKCSKAITKHSILIKGEEFCKPIDDTYLLMGEAYFYRQDYNDALRVFSYIINTHQKGNVWADAYTWKAKTFLQLNRIEEAEECLEQIRQTIANHKNKKYKQHWEAVIADKYILQKEYELAIDHLTELEKARGMKKDFKTRILFIAAQIYQEMGLLPEATKKYAKVLKRNPPYEMEFNATINMMLCQGKGAKSDAKNKLKKLLKDSRNEEYKDQIFYVLSKIDFQEEDTIAGIRNLEASVFWSINNKYQKTVSALELAEYFFSHSQFIDSRHYYDTVLSIIPSTFPNYTEIHTRAVILKELVDNLMIVKTQDSLQNMARMSESELNAYLDKIIADYQEKEEERIADEVEKAKMMENTKRTSSNARSSWVFYNTTQAKLGEQEFKQRWGRRILEDNWFISDKSSMMFMMDEVAQETESKTGESEETVENKTVKQGSRIIDPTNKQYYIQDIPKTEEDIQKSNEMIVAALYNAGFIYFDDLNDKEKANQQWESLLSRFPEHKLEAPTCFQLYKSYKSLNNNEKTEYYKNIILSKYPESDFAKIIQNPNYYDEIQKKAKEAQLFYADLYNDYTAKNYAQVVDKADEGLEKYLDPSIRKNMSYLRAVSLGKLNGDETMKKELQTVVQTYPATDIDTLAAGVLEALKRAEFEKSNVKMAEKDSSANLVQELKYSYDESNFHFVIIIVNIKEIKVDKLKLSLNNFNKEYFRLEKFDISNFYIDPTLQMITVSRFENKQKAMDYYNTMKINQTMLKDINQSKQTKIYVISDDNYNIYFKNKEKREVYDEFFIQYYLN